MLVWSQWGQADAVILTVNVNKSIDVYKLLTNHVTGNSVLLSCVLQFWWKVYYLPISKKLYIIWFGYIIFNIIWLHDEPLGETMSEIITYPWCDWFEVINIGRPIY